MRRRHVRTLHACRGAPGACAESARRLLQACARPRRGSSHGALHCGGCVCDAARAAHAPAAAARLLVAHAGAALGRHRVLGLRAPAVHPLRRAHLRAHTCGLKGARAAPVCREPGRSKHVAGIPSAGGRARGSAAQRGARSAGVRLHVSGIRRAGEAQAGRCPGPAPGALRRPKGPRRPGSARGQSCAPTSTPRAARELQLWLQHCPTLRPAAVHLGTVGVQRHLRPGRCAAARLLNVSAQAGGWARASRPGAAP